jgi:hypothetical protein
MNSQEGEVASDTRQPGYLRDERGEKVEYVWYQDRFTLKWSFERVMTPREHYAWWVLRNLAA